MLIKVSVNTAARREILDIAEIFRAKPVDVSDHTVTLQVSFLTIFVFLPDLLQWLYQHDHSRVSVRTNFAHNQQINHDVLLLFSLACHSCSSSNITI